MKIKIQSIRDFFKSKEKKGLKPIFFESIGDQNHKIINIKEELFSVPLRLIRR